VLLQNACNAVYFKVKIRTYLCRVRIKGDIAFEGNCQKVAFPGNGCGILGAQSVTHVLFPIVHHSADSGASKSPHCRADGRTDQCALRTVTDNLSEQRSCCSTTCSGAASSTMGGGSQPTPPPS